MAGASQQWHSSPWLLAALALAEQGAYFGGLLEHVGEGEFGDATERLNEGMSPADFFYD
jgi:hypothetical protein